MIIDIMVRTNNETGLYGYLIDTDYAKNVFLEHGFDGFRQYIREALDHVNIDIEVITNYMEVLNTHIEYYSKLFRYRVKRHLLEIFDKDEIEALVDGGYLHD